MPTGIWPVAATAEAPQICGGIYTVGLTGGIASGKSHIARAFAALGVPVLDADDAARAVVEPGSPVLAQIAARFGAQALRGDGRLDRVWLRAVVFADPQARRDLEGLTHPAIRAYIADWRAQQSAAYCMIVNAILFEAGMQQGLARVLVVDVPRALQHARLCARDGVSPAMADAMLEAQWSRAARLARADDVIGNADTSVDLAPTLHRLHRLYRDEAANVAAR